MVSDALESGCYYIAAIVTDTKNFRSVDKSICNFNTQRKCNKDLALQ